MDPYILDYSEPDHPGRQRHERKYRPVSLVFVLLNGLLYSIALVYLFRQHTEMRQIRQHYNDQVIQYDSLLAAKLETEQQLAALHRRLSIVK